MKPPVCTSVLSTARLITGVAAIHLMLTLYVTFASMGAVMSGMDGGRVASRGATQALGWASEALTFPLTSAWATSLGGPLFSAPVTFMLFVNSLLWSTTLWALGVAIWRWWAER